MDEGATIIVDLGEMHEGVEARVRSGAYANPSEVVRAGLEALAREESDFETRLREAVREALDDPRPPVPIEEGLARLQARFRADTARLDR